MTNRNSYKRATVGYCYWCDYYMQNCRKGHVCNHYKRYAKSMNTRNNKVRRYDYGE